jgi:hypothetical protein
VIGLADRWHCPPSVVLEQDARVLRLLDVYRLGRRDEEGEGGEDGC